VAIEGDFAGIQTFILKPVPGAKGAAKRLRGRSFQVSALTALIAHYVQNSYPGARITYLAGGRFLLNAPEHEAWRTKLQSIQSCH
jgi:CRISPR/Cas system-associated protein Cas10 (large subunit of type III CRISPR-Cas system)